MSNKSFSFFIGILFAFLCNSTVVEADVYTVGTPWNSEQEWGPQATTFTTKSENVYINWRIAYGIVPSGKRLRWYRPDGTFEDDVTGTGYIYFNYVYEHGLLAGFSSYMVIKGKNREPGLWRVDHLAYGSMDGVSDWYLMFSQYFTITQAVDNPTFTPVPGTYTKPQTVTLSCSTPSASIHFTIDGTEPIESSPVYSSPITVSKTTTIKAKAFKNDVRSSDTVIGTYIIGGGMPAILLLLLGD